MANILDLLRNPIQDEQDQPDYAATAVDLNAQSLPAPASMGAMPPPIPPPENAIVGQPGASGRLPAAQPVPDTASLVKGTIAKKYGYGPGADEASLQDAMRLEGNGKMYANMGAALNTITNAVSGRQQPADNKFFDGLASQAGDQVKNVQALRKGEQDDQAFQRQGELMDPTGVKAAIMRKQYAPLLKGLGVAPNALDGLSIQDMRDQQQVLEFLQRQKDSRQQHSDALEMKKIMAGQHMGELEGKHETESINKLHGDKTWQKQNDMVTTAEKLLDTLEAAKHNPEAANAVKTELANFVSEGQRLHTATIDSMGGSQATWDRLKQSLATKMGGTLDESNAENAKELVRHLQQAATKAKGKLEADAAGNYQKTWKKAPKWYTPTADDSAGGFDKSGLEAEMKRRGLK